MAPIVPKGHDGVLHTPSSPWHHKTFTFVIKEKFVRQTIMMTLWFIFSFGSIISNKYILSTLNGDASILGETQMVCSVIFGAFKMYLPCCLFHRTSGHHQDGHKFHFFRNMAILGDKSTLFVNLSLIPIMAGLSLCTATELSFNMVGFQNVFSKKLLSSDHPYSPPELQFYTSAAAIVVQLPFWFFMEWPGEVKLTDDKFLIFIFILNGFMFYMQSLTAFGLMSLISPVTFSVSNTAKRAVLIWLSVLVFGNEVSGLGAIGTIMVTVGVFFYQKAKSHQKWLREKATRQDKEHDS
ncbi:Solute carrier family 35 member E2A, partial [Acropora cervicornis]